MKNPKQLLLLHGSALQHDVALRYLHELRTGYWTLNSERIDNDICFVILDAELSGPVMDTIRSLVDAIAVHGESDALAFHSAFYQLTLELTSAQKDVLRIVL